MSDRDCEKIIDRAVASNGADEAGTAAEAHARTCPKCASTLALLALLKTSGSPTSDLAPSAAFLGKIESSLVSSASAATKTGVLTTKIIAAAIGIALTVGVAFTVLGGTKKTDPQNTATSLTTNEPLINTGTLPADNADKATEKQSEDYMAYPPMKFPSPTDEIK